MICRYKIKFISDIEQKIRKLLVNIAVAPFVGVWIEISDYDYRAVCLPSLPLWECGLKSNTVNEFFTTLMSLPLWECGLKFKYMRIILNPELVAPFVGVWIEIYLKIQIDYNLKSLPLWECGLK